MDGNGGVVMQALFAHPTIWVGLSGGMDSMVLLHQLYRHPVLSHRLQAIHIHHGLSPHADAWEYFCDEQCQTRNIPYQSVKVHLKGSANLEARAREARYDAFLKHVKSGDALVLAHHLDDEIETFFLNVLRGTGVIGLASMPMTREWKGLTIYRPLLKTPRTVIADYARQNQLKWIEDESNQNTDFSRNYLRQKLLPAIGQHWPHYRQSVWHTIESCQELVTDLEKQAHQLIPELTQTGDVLSLAALNGLSQVQINTVIRVWIKQHGLPIPPRLVLAQIITQMINRQRLDSQPLIAWSNVRLRLYRDKLYLSTSSDGPLLDGYAWKNFPEPLDMTELGILKAHPSTFGLSIDMQDKIDIRFRKGGEILLYKGHHRPLKKLFQQWGVPSFLRDQVPLVYVNDILQVVVGYAYADQCHQQGKSCYQIINGE